MQTKPWAAGAIVILLLAAVSACSPSQQVGGVIGLGEHSGPMSYFAPVTYYYDGVAGEQLNVSITVPAGTGSPSDTIHMTDPSGNDLVLSHSNVVLTHLVLPSTGRYAIGLSTSNGAQALERVILSHDEDLGAVPLGTELPVPLTGQTITYHYAGAAGEVLDVREVSFTAPDSSVLWPIAPLEDPAQGTITLPVTGSYLVRDVDGGYVGHDIDLGVVSLGRTVLPPIPDGQRVVVTYEGTAGEVLYTGDATSYLYDPTGTVVPFTYISLFDQPRTLPVTGSYTLIVFVDTANNIYLSHAIDAGPITLGNTTPPALEPSQPVVYTYQGTAGEVLRIGQISSDPVTTAWMALLDPSGSMVLNTGTWSDSTTGAFGGITSPLPVTGTYTLRALVPNTINPSVVIVLQSG